MLPILAALFCQETLLRADEIRTVQSTQADIQNLTNRDQQTRWHAARDLREKGPKAGAAISALIQVTKKDNSVDVRVEAVLALGEIGKAFPKAVEALEELVADNRSKLSQWAVIALGYSGPGAKDAVATVLKYLISAANSEEIFDSIETLGKIGPAARQAISVLEKYLKNSDVAPERGEIGAAAKKAIGNIRGREGVNSIKDWL